MKPRTDTPERVLFIEFATGDRHERLRPFAFVTSDNRRYDVNYVQDGTLVYHLSALGRRCSICYLENAEHQYWAAENITVVTNSSEPAPPESRVLELPVEFWGRFDEWPDMMEDA